MATKTKIDKGLLIRDKIFQGNMYAQFGYLMEGIKALDILRKNDSTQEEIDWAEEKMNELNNLFEKIQELRE